MTARDLEPRYIATPQLATIIDQQGRRRVWMGDQIGVSPAMVSRILAGTRTVSQSDAEHWASILGVPFSMLWKFATARKYARRSERFTDLERVA